MNLAITPNPLGLAPCYPRCRFYRCSAIGSSWRWRVVAYCNGSNVPFAFDLFEGGPGLLCRPLVESVVLVRASIQHRPDSDDKKPETAKEERQAGQQSEEIRALDLHE